MWIRVLALEWCKAGGELVARCDDGVVAEFLDRQVDRTLVDRVVRALPADGGAHVRSRALAWLGDVALVRSAWPDRLQGEKKATPVGRFVLTAEVFAEGTLLSALAKRNGIDEDEFRSFLARLRGGLHWPCLSADASPKPVSSETSLADAAP
ncbi:hypothetical protein AB0M48_38720 [Lentzea sp. NPDC051208]|uniref:hypothetical protein n=1 Tax=Lentzea sp. NPDC051208 TaxID=3154642 RepID=UPI00343404BE